MEQTSEAGIPEIEPVIERTFQDLVPSEKTRAVLDKLGFTKPTPVQQAALPAAYAGKDIIAQAKTGSGKTLAFALPMVGMLEQNDNHSGTLALVLTPTRELAGQICDVIHSVAPDVKPACLIGGISIGKQLRDLEEDRRVLVGSPGRVLDLLERREINLRSCRFFVVDEVDEMFSMDFVEDVRAILSRLPQQRQGMFVSATITPRVEMLAKTFLQSPTRIVIDTPGEELPPVEHNFCPINGDLTAKVNALCDIIETIQPRSAIIFCNTKSDTELVEVYLRRRGFDARLLNSDLNQRQRDAIVQLIKAGKLRFLIGTDIAARGLDIEHIDLVVNYSLPDQHESYVHRTGRTGRAGRSGRAISLIGAHDIAAFANVKRQTNFQFIEYSLPTEAQVMDARISHISDLVDRMAAHLQPREIEVGSYLLKKVGGIESPSPELAALVAKLCRSLLEHNASKVDQEAQGTAVVEKREAPEPRRHHDNHRHDDRRHDNGGHRHSGGSDRRHSRSGGRSRRGDR